MRRLFLCLSILFHTISYGQKRDVVLLGTFHFDNPGLDVVKFKIPNIKSEAKQKEVADIVKHLSDFKPDVIFIERLPAYQYKTDSLLNLYKQKQYDLGSSEIEQLGFRTAALTGARLEAVDFNETSFPFDSLMKSMAIAQQFQMMNNMKKLMDSVQNLYNTQFATKSVKDILLADNTTYMQDANIGFYLSLLPAGEKQNHVGSYLVSEWYRRNLVIFENILKRLKPTDKKILVLFGSSHTAMLSQFMRLNHDLNLVPLSNVLK